MDVLANEHDGEILTITEGGFGKRTPVGEYRLQSRGGKGIINIKTTDRNGKVAAILYVREDEQMMIVTEQGLLIRVACSSIRSTGRSAQGVKLINLDEGDRVVGAVKVVEKESDAAEEELSDESATGEEPETPETPETIH